MHNAHYDNELDDAPETPARQGFSRLVLWLAVISLAILFVPLSLAATTVQGHNHLLLTEAVSIQGTLDSPVESSAETLALRATLAVLTSRAEAMSTAQAQISAAHLNWPAAMAILGRYDPDQLLPLGISQTENRALLTGRAADEPVVMAYAQRLRDSGQFRRVIVQSVVRRAVSTPGGPAPTSPDGGYVEFILLLELKAGTP